MAAAMFHMFGPESLGGRGNVRITAEEEAKRSGRSFNEVALEVSSMPCSSNRHSRGELDGIAALTLGPLKGS